MTMQVYYLILVALCLTFVAAIWSAEGWINIFIKLFYSLMTVITWAIILVQAGLVAGLVTS